MEVTSPVGSADAPLRVEDLARSADVSVDTIRFYQKRGLLPPPERRGRIALYDGTHLDRLERIRALRREGLSLALIRRLLDGELDATDEPLAAAVAVAEADGPAEEFLTLPELAERSGVPAALLEAVAREGLLVARVHDGEERYTTGDVEIVAAGLRLLEAGLPLPELLALARDHHDATRAIAEQAVELFDAHVRHAIRASDTPADEKAERLVAAFREMLPAVTALVAHHFRRVLLEVAREHLERVGEPIEIDAASSESTRRIERGWPA